MRAVIWLAAAAAFLSASLPASAAGPITFTLDPQKAAQGDTVQFQGSGFTPGTEVVVVMTDDGIIVATVQADANASIRGSFTVPARRDLPGVQGDSVPVYAIEPKSGRESERTTFTFVDAAPRSHGAAAQVMLTIALTVRRASSPDATYWVLMGEPGTDLVAHRLVDPEGDGTYVFASEAPPGAPATVRVVEGRGTRETQYGPMPGDPIRTIRDFGTFVPDRDRTLTATTGAERHPMPRQLPSTGGGWGSGSRTSIPV